MSNTLGAMGYSKQLMQPKNAHGQISYRLDALNPDRNINKLVEGLKKHPQGRFCLYGPPGTGKTAFGHYIAKELGQKLLIKRASNILNAYVGGTEKGIADMFKQAQIDKSILMLDEADSFLQNRSNARHNWEITQVNELLTQMEDFDGLFICSTNLVDSLDGASIRRFDMKIKFDYLLPDQAWVLFQQTLQDLNNPVENEDHWKTELAKLCNLTPGDFATVVRQNKLSEEVLTPETLLQELFLEASFKQQPAVRGIGFTANF
jgi:SpoVK/Ycf46/Vps4 family AAA+-type ATPase